MPHADLHAVDVSTGWRERVAAAADQVMVFTPYFDRLLVDLLGESDLRGDRKVVVTDLSPRSGNQQYRAQLEAALELAAAGVELRSIDRLHAKVLVVDGTAVSVGSQNFTQYGTGSRETTAITDASAPEFESTIFGWFESANPVEEDFLRRLLDELEEQMRAVEDANAALTEAFDERWEQQLEKRRAAAEEKARVAAIKQAAADVGALRSAATARLRRTVSRRALTEVRGGLVELNPWEWDDDRMTFRVDARDGDFTQWLVRDEDGGRRTVRLDRLQMYPVVRLDTGRLAYTRAMKSQLSYARFTVFLRRLSLGTQSVSVSVELPQDPAVVGNLILGLYPTGWTGPQRMRAQILFGGADAELAAVTVPDDAPPWAAVLATELQVSESLTRLVASCLSPFRFAELKVQNANAGDFFPGWGTVRLIEFHGHPVLVVQ